MKKIANSWKIIQYLFWLGPMLAIAGLSAGVVSGIWQPVPLALIIAGAVIVGLWFVLQSYLRSQTSTPLRDRTRSTQVGTNALTATVSVLVILGLINFLAVRNPVRIDLTENQQFTLAPQTQTILENLNQPVKVWIFDRTQNPETKALLDRYRQQASGNFMYEFVDPQLQPGVAEQFGVRDFGEIYLEGNDRRQSVPVEGLEPLTEAKLTNSIEQIFSDRTPKIYFLQGHGERPLSEGQGGLQEALASLEDKNFIVEPLNLAEATEVPEDADAIAIAGPQQELFEGEVEALTEYLNSGGSLFLMIDPDTDPGLDDLLDEWGVKLDDRVAIDATGSGRLVGLGPTVPIVREYGDHPITRDFGNNISIYPSARPVETRPVEGVTESPLIWTDPQSWAEANLVEGRLEFDPQADRQGPLSLGVALTRSVAETDTSETPETPEAAETETSETPETPEAAETETPETPETPETETSETPETPETETSESETADDGETSETEETPEEAKLVVLGNSQFATNGWFDQQLNRDVFINSITWLSTDQETLSIGVKPATSRRILMTPPLSRFLQLMAIFIFPLIAFAIAGFLWWRRR